MNFNISQKYFLLVLLVCGSLLGQDNTSLWQEVSQSEISNLDTKYRKTTPFSFQLFKFNKQVFADELKKAPSRSRGGTSAIIVNLPVSENNLNAFRVFENSVFSKELQAKYPNIRAYTAQGIDDPSAIATITASNFGVHVMITSSKHKTIYIDPHTANDTYYIRYSREDLPQHPLSFECLIEENVAAQIPTNTVTRNADDGMLRTYRLALVCTGEYAQFHLTNQGVPTTASDAVKKAAVLDAMNVSMARVNGVFERDVAVRMELVPNNDDIIFLDPATDGLTNSSPFALLGECQFICDNIIGDSNYDIGHVFSTQGGGVAQLNAPCNSGVKAQGVTGINNPMGDPFDIDYVSHEMGHQYGANHPQNNDCNRTSASIEPGSASSIMGYAGICPPNVQNNSDDYFNGFSIIEMWNTIQNSDCAPKSPTNNQAPASEAGANYTIPHSTPFILKGTATDPDVGNELSYCWEQMDTQPAVMPPSATSAVGPLFRTLDPVAEEDRYMPALSTVLDNQLGTEWEQLPSVARTMLFRLTVRDNVAGGGASNSDLTTITTTANGPFEVTSQLAGTTWGHNSSKTITWNVAESNMAPVNAPNVDILLSLDGGANFDIVLASNVPNDGSHAIVSPAFDTTEARVMVRGTDHIFYDINEANFIIDGTLGTSDFDVTTIAVWPNPSYGEFQVSFTAENSRAIEIVLFDVKGRQITAENFTNNGGVFSEKVDYSSIANGMYFMKISNGDWSVTKQISKR